MLKKIWKIILLLIIIIVCVFFPEIIIAIGGYISSLGLLTISSTALAAFAASIPWWVGGVVGLGLAYVIDPDTTDQLISGLGDVAATVGGAVGGVIGSTASALLSKLLPFILAAGGVYLLLKSGNGSSQDEKDKRVVEDAKASKEKKEENKERGENGDFNKLQPQ